MKQLLRRVFGTFGLRIAYTLFTFITSFILARTLGANGFGIYSYSTSWAYLLAVPVSLGFPGLISKEAAIYQKDAAWNNLHGFLRWAKFISITVAFTTAVFASIVFWYFNHDNNLDLSTAFTLAMCSLPFVTYRSVNRGTMCGLSQTVTGFVSELLLSPILILFFLGLFRLVLDDRFSSVFAVGSYSLSAMVSTLLSIFLISRVLPSANKAIPPLKKQRLSWLNHAWPFMIVESLQVINTRVDILMLGAISGVDAAGIYAPVNRGSQLLALMLMSFGATLSPTVASLYAQGKTKELQSIMARSARLIPIASGVFAIILFSFASAYLQIFGPEFTAGTSALRIFAVGRFLYSMIGLSPMVLSMTGHAHLTATGGAISAGLNIILNVLLIPKYGVNGAAFSTVTSLMALGLFDMIWVNIKTGINPTFIGKVKH